MRVKHLGGDTKNKRLNGLKIALLKCTCWYVPLQDTCFQCWGQEWRGHWHQAFVEWEERAYSLRRTADASLAFVSFALHFEAIAAGIWPCMKCTIYKSGLCDRIACVISLRRTSEAQSAPGKLYGATSWGKPTHRASITRASSKAVDTG